MDLVTFTEGVQSIRIQHAEAPPADGTAKHFVPLGESVVQHTETLFSRQSTNQELLRSLIAPAANTSVDPNEFEAMAATTYATLVALERQAATLAESGEQNKHQHILQKALSVLNALNEDRRVLQNHLSALEKV